LFLADEVRTSKIVFFCKKKENENENSENENNEKEKKKKKKGKKFTVDVATRFSCSSL